MEVETQRVGVFDVKATVEEAPIFSSSYNYLGRAEIRESPENEALFEFPAIKHYYEYEGSDSVDHSAAMKVQKFYRGYRTRRLLADSAVVAEELWYVYIFLLFYTIYLLLLYYRLLLPVRVILEIQILMYLVFYSKTAYILPSQYI